MIHFEIPKNQSSIIKVIGVGGGGGNAVNYMYNLGIDGVDFIVCNTDSQALAQSAIPNKIQLGPHLTQGLGAGANPEIGKQAGKESIEDIAKILRVNTRMAFITAGMGGGTGTGSAPVISAICRELGILTVGIVTTPFTYEGRKRLKQAQDGIEEMRKHVDTILIISNDKLRQQYGNLPFTQAFAKADNILATAAKCITDLITVDGRVNLDFNDVQTVMKSGGVAILGSAQAEGENRAQIAVKDALNSPLLNDSEIKGAKWILLNVTSAVGEFEHTLDELEVIQGYVQDQAGNSCDIILGMGHDPALENKIAVTIIATGFTHKEIIADMPVKKSVENDKIIVTLQGENTIKPTAVAEVKEEDPLAPKLVENIPTTNCNEPAKITEDDLTHVIRKNLSETKSNEENTLHSDAHVNSLHESFTQQAEKNIDIELVIKNEARQQENEVSIKRGNRVLSADEIEEELRFEEQKRALEERAERLRRMSFNFQSTDASEVENVPAYLRKNIDLDKEMPSSQNYYSGYSLDGGNDNNNQANISSINTFLDGKKPD